MRQTLICGNWKLHQTIAAAVALARAVRETVDAGAGPEVAMAPVFTALHAVATELRGSKVALAAQDCHWEDEGAYTGEVSAKLLKDVGCRYVIIGHSERRQLFGESDRSANLKARAALRHGLRPILCVGETLAERDRGQVFGVVERQLEGGLLALTAADAGELVVAYEPVWAIGTGRTATPEQAEEVHSFLRERLTAHFGAAADATRVIYGGSVKPDNAALLLTQPSIDGALVGGASLKADDFLRIVKYRDA